MEKKTVLVFGTGHLVFQMKKLLNSRHFTVIHCVDHHINDVTASGAIVEHLEQYFKTIPLENIGMIFLLDDKDEDNLQLIIALRHLKTGIPVTASLFNVHFSAELFEMDSRLTILNPAKIAAGEFVKALYEQTKPAAGRVVLPPARSIPVQKDTLIKKLVLGLLALSVSSIIYFHYAEQMSWMNSLYFVVVIITTVGFGDLNLLASGDLSKTVGIVLMLGSTVLVWTIFSLMIDHFLKNRIQLSLGRRKYKTRDHFIVCGLGRLGYSIVEELISRKERVIIIEKVQSQHVDYLRSIGAEVYIGDGRSEKVLADVNITQSAALVSVINNDALNIEIGLHARTLYPDLKIVLRIFDEEIAGEIKDMMHIHKALSHSAIAAGHFVEVLENSYEAGKPREKIDLRPPQ